MKRQVPLVTHIDDRCQREAINTSIKAAEHFLDGYVEDETKQRYKLVKYSGYPSEFRPDVRVSNVYWVGQSGSASMVVGYNDSNGIYISCPTTLTCTIYGVTPGTAFKCQHYNVTDCWHGIDGVCCYNFVNCSCSQDNKTDTWKEYCMLCYFFLCRTYNQILQRYCNHYCVFPFNVKSGVSCIDMTCSAVNIYQKVLDY